jgi:hypothetical protein
MPGHIPWSKVDLPRRAFRSIWVSTTRGDGRPHAVPVWCLWDGRDVYFVASRNSQKARNVARQPWVIGHAGDGDDVIILEGPDEKVAADAERRRIDAAYREKYVDPHSGAQASVLNEGDDLYSVRVHRVIAWEYGVVANRTDWSFDPESGSRGPCLR